MRPQSIEKARTTAEVFIETGTEDEKLDFSRSARRLLLLAVTVGLCMMVNWLAG